MNPLQPKLVAFIKWQKAKHKRLAMASRLLLLLLSGGFWAFMSGPTRANEDLILWSYHSPGIHGPSKGRLNSAMLLKSVSAFRQDRIEGIMSSGIGANLSRLSKGEIDLQWTWTQAFAWRIVQGKVQGGYVLISTARIWKWMEMWRKLSLIIWNWSLPNSCISPLMLTIAAQKRWLATKSNRLWLYVDECSYFQLLFTPHT